MNKAQLIDAVAKLADVPKNISSKLVDAFIDTVTGALASGDVVSLIGFGTFSVKERAARLGRNPKTGEEIQISAAKVPSFKAGKAFKEAVSEAEAGVVEEA